MVGMDELQQPVPKKHRLDGELFWMLFALAAVLVLLYMAWDFRTAVDAATQSVTASKCNEILLNRRMSFNFSR